MSFLGSRKDGTKMALFTRHFSGIWNSFVAHARPTVGLVREVRFVHL